jgi:hypothetical protein
VRTPFEKKRLELERQAVERAFLMLILCVVFLYCGVPGMTILCAIVGIAWIAMSEMRPK